MNDVVNLRMARKAKARAEGEAAAAQNRVAHGRTKAEKLRAKAEAEIAASKLTAHRREHED